MDPCQQLMSLSHQVDFSAQIGGGSSSFSQMLVRLNREGKVVNFPICKDQKSRNKMAASNVESHNQEAKENGVEMQSRQSSFKNHAKLISNGFFFAHLKS
jgi:threonine dehydrogenase-like Zn-dependent dehydrogenase